MALGHQAESEPGTRAINWGCIGTGTFAIAMAEQLSMLSQANLVAICPATGRRVDASQLYGFERVVVNYEALVRLPEIDIVYIASANTDHAKHSMAALRAGKHVLCQTPVAMSLDELKEVHGVARMYHRLFMDGISQAYLPSFHLLKTVLKTRGTPMQIRLNSKIEHKLMKSSTLLTSPLLGGGIYEGTGSYTAHMLVMLMGTNAIMALRPERVIVSSTEGPGSVDWQTIVSIEFPSGTTATLSHVAYDDTAPSKVTSFGGAVEFNLPKISSITVEGDAIDLSLADLGQHSGLGWEAIHAMDLIVSNSIQSPRLSNEVSLATTHLMDLVRSKIRTHPRYGSPTERAPCFVYKSV